jgi:hypothetical protein
VGTVQAVAPAGGVTIKTLVLDSTTRVLLLPLQTATSGSTYTALTTASMKRLKGVTAGTAAWAAGDKLVYASATSNFLPYASGTAYIICGHAAAAKADAATTGDIDLGPQVSAL